MPNWSKVFVQAPGTWTGAEPPLKVVTEDVALPEPGAGEVLLQHLAGGLAWADTMMAEGKYPAIGAKDYPIVLGYDTVARVLKAGSGVSLKEGQLVAALTVHGSNQTYSVRKADDLVPVPEGLDPAVAVSCVLNYVTAYQMLHRTRAKKFGTDHAGLFVVHAASGGVGTALLDILRAEYPKAKVLGTCSASKKKLVEERGGIAVDYNSEDWTVKAKELAPGGASAIFDSVGSESFKKSYAALSPEGALVIYGFTRDVAGGGSMIWAIAKTAFSVFIPAAVGRLFGYKHSAEVYVITDYKDKSVAEFKEDLGKILQMTKEGKLDPEVQAVGAIEDAADVYKFFRAGNSRGKVGDRLQPERFGSC
ncbi:chaperonin 10-like protein [Hyaloraphidium curvatum]|nr:chaperonin 10-like protein [Hyaloraphidium curvatum]